MATAKKPTAGPKPEFVVIGKTLHFTPSKETTFDDGKWVGEIVIPLSMKFKLLRQIREQAANDEGDQLMLMLKLFGRESTIAQIDELDALDEFPRLLTRYFEEFEKAQEARRLDACQSARGVSQRQPRREEASRSVPSA
jgi:hypothetical protein